MFILPQISSWYQNWIEPFNPFMTKYGMTTKKDSSTLEVTSTQEAPIPSKNGGSDDAALLITKHKLNG